MATVNTTEILGSDSISGSRVTINSNFLILQNWINGYVTVFGVDSVNGILDLTGSATGKVAAKIGAFNSIAVPAIGTSTASVNSAGQAAFSSVTSTSLTSSGSVTFSGTVSVTSAATMTVGGTASFNGALNANGALYLGTQGHVISNNWTANAGITAGTSFPANNLGGGGLSTSANSPYALTGLEDVIYANCAGPTGFYLKVVGGTGATAANIPQGSRITIINTSSATGFIATGTAGSPIYYTGFNNVSTYGGFATGGIIVPQNEAYRYSISLQWEPRIANNQISQRGSWVVLGSTNMTI
jgi:hypothetical protein